MALILALNPGNSHSPTLSRLARELHGCELIGAESCVVGDQSHQRARARRPPAARQTGARRGRPARAPENGPRRRAHVEAAARRIGRSARSGQTNSRDADGRARLRSPGLPRASARRRRRSGACGHVAAPARGGSRSHQLDSQPTRTMGRRAAGRCRSRACRAMDRRVPPNPTNPTNATNPTNPLEPTESDDPYAIRRRRADEPRRTHPRVLRTADKDVAAARGRSRGRHRHRGRPGVVLAADSRHIQQHGRRKSMHQREVSPARRGESETSRAASRPRTPEADPLAKVSGWVAVFAPFDVSISEGNQGVQVDDRGRAMLAPGRHRLRFQNRELGYDETRTVEVRPAETTTINLTPQTTIGVTSNEPAEVLIDGTRVGRHAVRRQCGSWDAHGDGENRRRRTAAHGRSDEQARAARGRFFEAVARSRSPTQN